MLRDPVEERHRRARSLSAAGSHSDALAELDAVLAMRPDFAAALNDRGTVRTALKDNSGAIADYSAAIGLQPEFTAALNNRAVAFTAAGDFRAALQDLHAAIRIDPSFAEAYENCATVHGNLYEHVKAVANFNRAIAIYGADPRQASRKCVAVVRRAMARYHLRQWRVAALGFREAWRSDPLLASGTMASAIEQNVRIRGAAAITDCDAYLAQSPDDFISYFRRAFTHQVLGHEHEIAKDTEAAFQVMPREGRGFARVICAAVQTRLSTIA